MDKLYEIYLDDTLLETKHVPSGRGYIPPQLLQVDRDNRMTELVDEVPVPLSHVIRLYYRTIQVMV